LDGSTGVSFAEDHRLIVWDVSKDSNGQALLTMDVHCGLQQLLISPNLNHVVGQPSNCTGFALFRFLRNPARQKSIEELSRLRDQRSDFQRFHRQLSTLAQLGAMRPMALRRSIKREQSFDSLYWDRQLQRGMSVDDFSRLTGGSNALGPLSPAGSRDSLLFAGTGSSMTTNVGSGFGTGGTNMGTLEKIGQSMVSRPSRLVSKLIGGKQRTLKKQQSMFACFPEHSSSSGVLNTVGRIASPLASPAALVHKLGGGPLAQQCTARKPLVGTTTASITTTHSTATMTATASLASKLSGTAGSSSGASGTVAASFGAQSSSSAFPQTQSPLTGAKTLSPDFGSSRTISRLRGEERSVDSLMRSHSLEEPTSGACPVDSTTGNLTPPQQTPPIDSSICSIS
jgi:hypothetical protein